MRQAYVFVMVLGYSRHMVTRIVFDQKVETWLRLHVEAFEELGMVRHRGASATGASGPGSNFKDPSNLAKRLYRLPIFRVWMLNKPLRGSWAAPVRDTLLHSKR